MKCVIIAEGASRTKKRRRIRSTIMINTNRRLARFITYHCTTILLLFIYPKLITSFHFHRTSLVVHNHPRHPHHPQIIHPRSILGLPGDKITQSSSTSCLFSAKKKNNIAVPSNTPTRKKKKNKYAKFSKVDTDSSPSTSNGTDKQVLDPFEALLAESEAKNKQIQKEKAMKRNRDVRDLLDEETLQTLKNEKRQRNKILFPDNKSIDPYDPTTYGYTELGTILGPHGVYGLCKVSAVTDFPERLCKPGIRHLKAPNRRSPREIKIVEGRHRLKDEYLVKLEHVGDRNAALKLRGSVLFARQEERPEGMNEDEFLIDDLVNLEVRLVTGYGEDFDDDEEKEDGNSEEQIADDIEEDGHQSKPLEDNNDSLGGKFIGIVGGVVMGEEMCAIPGLGQDLLEIILPKGKYGTPSWKDELVLIPFVPAIVPTVDIQQEVIYINPPRGLLDLTYVKEEKTRIKGFLPEKSSWTGNHK